MSDHTDDEDPGEETFEAIDDYPPSYHSGRVRIIGAEPAGNSIREVTGPVVDDIPDMPHWNDAPTGQVPAVLDRGNGDEPGLAPPTWREEHTDWAAHEELFEPSMLSGELPAVGSMANDSGDQVDVERQPWHFEPADLPRDDETMVIGSETEAEPAPPEPVAASWSFPLTTPPEPALTTTHTPPEPPSPPDTHTPPTTPASRLVPPTLPTRAPRASRLREDGRNVDMGGTDGRNMRVAIGSGILLGIVALLCFRAGAVPTLVLSTVVVLFAAAEGFAAFRRAQYHPATLLGLVAILSLMIETYNKGVSALPLVLVMLVAASFIWFLTRVEPTADPVAGLASTVFVFAWVGGFGSFGALLLNPTLFPHRHGVAFFVAAVLVTVAADVAALLVGAALGRHPMAPSVSPNKTWEGFFGGAAAAVLMAVVVVHFIHPWTVSKALVLGVVVAVVAPLGDLSQSMIKRHLGVKDMGSLMPGHGGILDRIDGLLFVLPATYFVVKALHLG